MVFKGTAVVQGSTGVAVVTATGMATEMGRIAHLLAATRRGGHPCKQEVRQIGACSGVRCC